MPPYVNSTADITITGVSSTASSRRRKLQATSGSADVTTELGVANAHTVADTATHLSSVVGNTKFLVRHLFCCCYCESLVVTKAAAHPTCGSDKPWGGPMLYQGTALRDAPCLLPCIICWYHARYTAAEAYLFA